MKNDLGRYHPWLIYVPIGIITVALCIWGAYSIWYNYFDVSYVPGKVTSFSWQMDVYEYHLVTEEKSDWADELEDGNYDVDCYPKWRTITETQPDGSTIDYEIIDQYCDYKIDEWDYHQTIPNSGTDKNPFYSQHPTNSTKVKYEEQPGVFTVYFTTDIIETVAFNYDRATWDAFRDGMSVMVGISRQGTVPYPPKLPQ